VLKCLHEFLEAVFLCVALDSLLDDEEVRQPSVTCQKGHNVLSSRWIAFKFLHEFSEAVFLMVALESLLGEEEVWSARLV
jgi:hypothetical protein